MVLSEEEKEWLLTFFDRLDITYINPDRKDNVYIGKKMAFVSMFRNVTFCGS